MNSLKTEGANVWIENNAGYQKALLEFQAASVLCTQWKAERFELGHKHKELLHFSFKIRVTCTH